MEFACVAWENKNAIEKPTMSACSHIRQITLYRFDYAVLYCTAAVRCCNVDVLNTQCTTLLCFGLLLNVVERIASRSQMNRQNNCNGICASDVSIRILNHKLNACFMLKDLFGWICW